jgi:hypothetical protein
MSSTDKTVRDEKPVDPQEEINNSKITKLDLVRKAL